MCLCIYRVGHDWLVSHNLNGVIGFRLKISQTYFVCSECFTYVINLSPHNAAYMRQWTGSSLVQFMACRLFDAKPLPESMLVYCKLDSCEKALVKFLSEFYHFHSRKCNWKCRLLKWRLFCPGGDELISNAYCHITALSINKLTIIATHSGWLPLRSKPRMTS